MSTIGLINPGEMGASIGAAALVNEHSVIWAGNGRSQQSHRRAQDAGIEDCGDLKALCTGADIILSVCPPDQAMNTASAVTTCDFGGIYVDCNAVAPETTRSIAALFSSQENNLVSRYVDGGIIGGPAWRHEDGTTLYLSGERAHSIAQLFENSPLKTDVLSDTIGHASALKMVFAAYTKGSTALLAAILGVAEAEGVRSALEAQWGESFTQSTHQRLISNSVKAWRFAGEMEEIAATFSAAGFSDGYHLAAADTYHRLAEFKDNRAENIESLLSAFMRNPSA